MKIRGKSCSSRGYRLPETPEQCEGIAKYLKLDDTEALTHGLDCPVDMYSRCVYKEKELFWNPRCGDSSDGNTFSNMENLCILTGAYKYTKKCDRCRCDFDGQHRPN